MDAIASTSNPPAIAPVREAAPPPPTAPAPAEAAPRERASLSPSEATASTGATPMVEGLGETFGRARTAVQNRDFQGQREIGRELHERAAGYELLSPDQRAAGALICGDPQRTASVQASAFVQDDRRGGRYTRQSLGVTADTQGNLGTYHSRVNGRARGVTSPVASATGFSERERRTSLTDNGIERSRSTNRGVRVERSLGRAHAGLELGSQGAALTGRLQGPGVSRGGGVTRSMGVDAEVRLSGNGQGRDFACRALDLDRNNQETANLVAREASSPGLLGRLFGR